MNNLKIAIIGTRGIPAAYGGFETFAEEVSIRMVKKGFEVVVIGDSSLNYKESYYKGVRILKSEISKPSNPLGFYGDSMKIAKKEGASFIIMCGVGGSLLIPFYRNKNTIIAVNPDGLGFKRDKYVWWKKAIFFSQYLVASIVPSHIICDSEGIKNYYSKIFKRKKNVTVIEYGTYLNKFNNTKFDEDTLNKYDLDIIPHKYHLVVSRLEPENNVEIIIQGYLKTPKKFPLIIVGNTNTKHSQELIKYKSEHVKFVGGIYERDKLMILRAASLSYLHGHSVGGTNPSLLEAMGSKNICICHDNIFNREVMNNNSLFFKDVNEVSERIDFIENILNSMIIDKYKIDTIDRAKEYYSWENITNKYLKLAINVTK